MCVAFMFWVIFLGIVSWVLNYRAEEFPMCCITCLLIAQTNGNIYFPIYWRDGQREEEKEENTLLSTGSFTNAFSDR